MGCAHGPARSRRSQRGAVSIGDVWKFGSLDRAEKRITEDLNTYSVPTVVEQVMQILVAILTA